mmetsp:Transcript_16161/g.32709  ORF Transcript_16161/g.32709 Transcript_16161/m.32709 type:complete len:417 (+) Transcript_16161:2141-3391(+)
MRRVPRATGREVAQPSTDSLLSENSDSDGDEPVSGTYASAMEDIDAMLASIQILDVVPRNLREQHVELVMNFEPVQFPTGGSPNPGSRAQQSNDAEVQSRPDLSLADPHLEEIVADPLAQAPEVVDALLELIADRSSPHSELFPVDAQERWRTCLLASPVAVMRIRCTSAIRSYQEQAPKIRSWIEAYVDMARQVQSSEKLQRALHFVLVLGRYVNKDEANVEGFRLDILPQLNRTPFPRDNALTMADALIRIIDKKDPSLLPLDDLPTLARVKLMPDLLSLEEAISDLLADWSIIESTLKEIDENSSDPFERKVMSFLEALQNKDADGCTGSDRWHRDNAEALDAIPPSHGMTAETFIALHGILRAEMTHMLRYLGEENEVSRERMFLVLSAIQQFVEDLDEARMKFAFQFMIGS